MNNQEILAVVGGKEITTAELEAFLKNVSPEQKMYAGNPQYRDQFIEQLIIINAYAKLAEDMKLDETEAYKMAMDSARRDILAQMAIQKTQKVVEITDEEAKEFYEANPQHFEKGATISAKHILVAEEEKCNSIKEAIEKGETEFEAAAKEFSTCPSGSAGGDLGEFGRGQMVPEFEETAFAAEIGQVVGPVKTQFGYHLIKVEAKNEASIVPFEEAENNIKRNLLQQKQNQFYMDQIKELKAKYVQSAEK